MPLRGEPLGPPLEKPERQRYVKNRAKRTKKLTRSQVVELVYRREKMRCQRCGWWTRRPSECYYGTDPNMAHVNELVPRSKGGNPLDPDNCELICQGCHMPGGNHAPTPERLAILTGRQKGKA